MCPFGFILQRLPSDGIAEAHDTLEIDGAFVAVGHEPNTALTKGQVPLSFAKREIGVGAKATGLNITIEVG